MHIICFNVKALFSIEVNDHTQKLKPRRITNTAAASAAKWFITIAPLFPRKN
jgi:hypothetical protein